MASKRRSLGHVVAGILLSAGLGCGGGSPGRPNVVLIVIDTLRADRLGVYGCPEDTSPALDALAARGALFLKVVSPSSWTRPAIGSLLTSRYPRSIGIYHEYWDALDDRFTTLAEVLWAAGYQTLGATANPNINATYRFDQGFDAYSDSDVLFPWMRPERGKRWLSEHPLPSGPDIYAALLARLGARPRLPFYVQVNVMEVHEYHLFAEGSRHGRYTNLFGDRADAAYLRAVRATTDDAVGFIRSVVALLGGENTLFVITSDHSEGLGDHPDVKNAGRHGFVLYGSQLLVPLVLYDPLGRIPTGGVVDDAVSLLDVMPTILDFAGVKGPPQMQGRSLLPLLRGEERRPSGVFVSETNYQRRDKLAVYSGRWRYYENRESFSDLPARTLQRAEVPENGSRTDVADQHPEVVERLAAQLHDWERRYPREKASRISEPRSPAEEEQLRKLGYVE